MKQKLDNIFGIIKSYDYKSPSYQLIFYCLCLSVIGILAIHSATGGDIQLVSKQIFGLAAGIVCMMIMALIPYDFLARYYWLMYFINILLLLLVRFAGTYRGGAKRWIIIAGIQIQPSEISKLLLLFFFASLLAHNRQSLNSMKFFIFTAVTFAVPIMLIMLEPDLSTSIVIIVMYCSVIFVGNFHAKILKTILIIIVPIMAIVVTLIIILPAEHNIIPLYQYNRLVGFYEPDNEVAESIRYQQENSILAIASGSVTGKGLNNNSITSVKNAEFISEPQTDFIFTIIGEELGFFGALVTIVLLALVVIECFRIGIRARESIGKCIAIGYGTLIGMQAFINLGVVTMILPNTGLTLPFVSYGLSSLTTSFIGIGIVLNVSMRKKLII
ncbi:MAG: FtsW/RodA/SpoVE family cell cycle protein [Parasporobacterium sp.]|nr:FtsW/RodA/SpoVE family cell cycle protein [Parasporobacterium sp.]